MASQPAPELRPIPSGVLRVAASPEQATLAALLQFEAEVRRQPTEAELLYHVANESRRILPYDQMFILRQARIGDGYHVIAASSIAVIDRTVPLIHFIEQTIARLAKADGAEAPRGFSAGDFAQNGEDAISDYPFHAWHWQPLFDSSGAIFAAILIARSDPLREAEAFRLDRITETVGHSWRALAGGMPVKKIAKFDKRQKKALAIILTIVALMPVQMSALAPVEVVAARPFIVSAPFSGVVSRIEVPPSSAVRKGQPLIQFEDVKLRNEYALATEKLGIARARVERASTAAFGAVEESREIAITRAEYELADADHRYAADLLAKSKIVAPRDGMAIYTDRREWEGRAVNVGEAIMQVADPKNVQFRIDLPAHEQMALAPNARIKVWLDSQPFWAVDARLKDASYQARMTPENVLAFSLTAKPVNAAPRIGSRGTARVYGRWVPFIYSMLKRPISSARQYIGY
jgi:hypothetical protein